MGNVEFKILVVGCTIMDMKIIRKTDTEIVIQITGEDDTLGNLISKEAMKHPKVIYATYRIPHPLQNKLELIIRVEEGSNIGQVLVEIVDRIKIDLEEFRKEVEEKI